MAERILIDAANVIAWLNVRIEMVRHGYLPVDAFAYYGEALALVKNLPTIEDEPVRHGEWIVYTEFFETVCNLCSEIKMAKCSCCGHTAQYANLLSVTKNKTELPEFCPNCGAEMSIKTKEDNRNTAKWIPTEYDSYADGAPVWDMWECSNCGHEHSGEEDTLTAFCPDCGARMDGGGADNG